MWEGVENRHVHEFRILASITQQYFLSDFYLILLFMKGDKEQDCLDSFGAYLTVIPEKLLDFSTLDLEHILSFFSQYFCYHRNEIKDFFTRFYILVLCTMENKFFTLSK